MDICLFCSDKATKECRKHKHWIEEVFVSDVLTEDAFKEFIKTPPKSKRIRK